MSSKVAEVSLQYLAVEPEHKIPIGYKRAEKGLIPEDWDVQPLGLHATFKTGPFGSALHQSDYVDGGIPIVNPMQIVDARIEPTSSMSISEDVAKKLSEFRLSFGEIVIGRRGDMGRCAVVTENEDGWLCGTGSMIIRAKSSCNPSFLQRILSSQSTISEIENASVGSTMINLNQGTLKGLHVLIPRQIKEQTAIANALSDVDALIQELEKLIAKKQAIKTATMQQLLTGRTRLPQFAHHPDGRKKGYKPSELGEIPEDWEVYYFGNHFTIYAGGDVPKDSLASIRSESFPIPIFANAITDKGLYGYTSQRRSKAESVTITARGYLGHAEYRTEEFFPIVRLLVMEPKGELDAKFTAYSINEFIEFPSESTGVPQLTAPQVGSFSVVAPCQKCEQTAISSILTVMDEEIGALEQRLNKTRQIKQGMMQELLTGKTRLVKPAGAA